MTMAVPPTAPPGAPEDATFDLWIVGVILAALSNMLSSLGLLIMKISADQDKGKACHRRWRFWLGFGINLGSEVTITPIALSLAPVSLLAPMTAIGIAGSVLIAASGCLRGLKESIGPREVGAILLIIAGVVLSTAFGPRSDNEPSIDAAEAAVRSPACIVSFACVFLFTATWVAVRRLKRGPADGTLVVCLMSSVDASCLAAMSVVFLKVTSVATLTLTLTQALTLTLTQALTLTLTLTLTQDHLRRHPHLQRGRPLAAALRRAVVRHRQP
jgi:drug/metabolite transporter (DMT)-like permease